MENECLYCCLVKVAKNKNLPLNIVISRYMNDFGVLCAPCDHNERASKAFAITDPWPTEFATMREWRERINATHA